MKDFEETWDRFKELSTMITDSNGEVNLRFAKSETSKWPFWYRKALTELHFATVGKEIQYLSSSIDGGNNEPKGEIVAFTASTVVRVALTARPELYERVGVQTDVWSRKLIQHLSVEDIDVLDPAVLPDNWPRYSKITALYAHGYTLGLPIGSHPTEENLRELVEFQVSLLDDLEQGSLR